jgi:hypothetical protein
MGILQPHNYTQNQVNQYVKTCTHRQTREFILKTIARKQSRCYLWHKLSDDHHGGTLSYCSKKLHHVWMSHLLQEFKFISEPNTARKYHQSVW